MNKKDVLINMPYTNAIKNFKLSPTLRIFSSKINKSVKTIPLNLMDKPIGKSRYFPPSTREWTNSIYCYNTNSVLIKNLPVLGKTLSDYIKSYFSIYYKTLKKSKFLDNTVEKSQNYLPVEGIYVSKAELKHTSDKVIITLYVYNQQKINYLNSLNNLLHDIYINKHGNYISKWFKVITSSLAENHNRSCFDLAKSKVLAINVDNNLIIKEKYNQLFKDLKYIAKNLDLNVAKFSYDDNYIKNLTSIISKLYDNKKVEFNIVNIKNLYNNIDILTQSMAIQLKHRKNTLVKVLKYALALIKIPNLNHSLEKFGKIDKFNKVNIIRPLKIDLQSLIKVNPEISIKKSNSLFNLENKDILSVLLSNTMPTALNSLQLKHKNIMLEPFVFSNIKYKLLKGLKFKIKGRLTRRLTAERAVLKVRWVNGIQNMDSSYKGLSSVLLRGHEKSNLDYAYTASKVRNGAFGIKGWTSNK